MASATARPGPNDADDRGPGPAATAGRATRAKPEQAKSNPMGSPTRNLPRGSTRGPTRERATAALGLGQAPRSPDRVWCSMEGLTRGPALWVPGTGSSQIDDDDHDQRQGQPAQQHRKDDVPCLTYSLHEGALGRHARGKGVGRAGRGVKFARPRALSAHRDIVAPRRSRGTRRQREWAGRHERGVASLARTCGASSPRALERAYETRPPHP